MPPSKSQHEFRWITASQLARMGVCERQVQFAEKLGLRSTEHQQLDQERGTQAHEAFHQEGLRGRPRHSHDRPRSASTTFVRAIVALIVLYILFRSFK